MHLHSNQSPQISPSNHSKSRITKSVPNENLYKSVNNQRIGFNGIITNIHKSGLNPNNWTEATIHCASTKSKNPFFPVYQDFKIKIAYRVVIGFRNKYCCLIQNERRPMTLINAKYALNKFTYPNSESTTIELPLPKPNKTNVLKSSYLED